MPVCLGFASHAQVLYPPLILVLPIPLNLAFLIVCSSRDPVMPHLPALNEAGCCLSVSHWPDKPGCQPRQFQVSFLLWCSQGWQVGPASHRDELAIPRACGTQEDPWCASPQLLPHLSFWEVGQKSSWDAISFIYQWLPEL